MSDETYCVERDYGDEQHFCILPPKILSMGLSPSACYLYIKLFRLEEYPPDIEAWKNNELEYLNMPGDKYDLCMKELVRNGLVTITDDNFIHVMRVSNG